MSKRRGPRRDAAKERFWRKLIGGFDPDRTSVRQWCAEHGVSEPSFYAWRRELQRRSSQRDHQAGTERGVKLLRVRIARPTTASNPAAAKRVTICRSGLRLHVAIEQLRDVLDVLESRPC